MWRDSFRKKPVYLRMVLLGLALLGTIVLPKEGIGQGVPVKMGDVYAYQDTTGYLIIYFYLFDENGLSISASGKVDYYISIRSRKTNSEVLSCSLTTRLVNPEDFQTPILAYYRNTQKPIRDCKKVVVCGFRNTMKVFMPDGKDVPLMGLLVMDSPGAAAREHREVYDVWAIIRFSPLEGKPISGEGRVGWDIGRES